MTIAAPTPAEVLAMCESIRECDDMLGQASDHEGDEAGPTFHMWGLGQQRFADHADALIEWHRRAIYRLTKAKRLNARRAP